MHNFVHIRLKWSTSSKNVTDKNWIKIRVLWCYSQNYSHVRFCNKKVIFVRNGDFSFKFILNIIVNVCFDNNLEIGGMHLGFLLPRRLRKAGRVWCGGARETRKILAVWKDYIPYQFMIDIKFLWSLFIFLRNF